jgi:hypothetical protein
VLYSSLSPLNALRHQGRPPLFVVDFRITPSRARRTLRPTNRNKPAGSEPYWQAFRIAGQDLGLDITQENVEAHLQTTTLNTYRESVASSHSSRASTPLVPSVIRPRPSPYQPGSRDQEIAHSLAESLNINEPMSNTLTMEVPAGTINPITGHVDADDAALFRAIGPDQPDPPSVSGTDRTTHIPFGWIRPQGGGMPKPRRYIYGGGPPGGGPPGRGPPGGGPPRGGPPGGPFGPPVLRFAKRGPTWTMIMWMQPLVTQLWSSDTRYSNTRYSNTRSPLYVRRRSSTSTKIER